MPGDATARLEFTNVATLQCVPGALTLKCRFSSIVFCLIMFSSSFSIHHVFLSLCFITFALSYLCIYIFIYLFLFQVLSLILLSSFHVSIIFVLKMTQVTVPPGLPPASPLLFSRIVLPNVGPFNGYIGQCLPSLPKVLQIYFLEFVSLISLGLPDKSVTWSPETNNSEGIIILMR